MLNFFYLLKVSKMSDSKKQETAVLSEMVDFENGEFWAGECHAVAMYIKENGKLQYHWKRSIKRMESHKKDNGKLQYLGKSQVI
jgi:hypothetical protein